MFQRTIPKTGAFFETWCIYLPIDSAW